MSVLFGELCMLLDDGLADILDTVHDAIPVLLFDDVSESVCEFVGMPLEGLLIVKKVGSVGLGRS